MNFTINAVDKDGDAHQVECRNMAEVMNYLESWVSAMAAHDGSSVSFEVINKVKKGN